MTKVGTDTADTESLISASIDFGIKTGDQIRSLLQRLTDLQDNFLDIHTQLLTCSIYEFIHDHFNLTRWNGTLATESYYAYHICMADREIPDRHPTRDIKSTLGDELAGRKIVLCVTGSVAAVRSPEIARLLIRHGAEVFPVMSREARRLIHPNLLTWACGHRTLVKLTGAIEHVALAGNVRDKADLVLVAPATANTIGKMAAGIDDTAVTTVVTTAIGEGIPLIVVPAMHEPMYRHPIVGENIAKLEGIGLRVLLPRMDEGKAKIVESELILREAISIFRGPLSGRKVLITAGRTVEYLDPIRVITNNSTGKMGMALVRRAAAAGAQVTLVYGKGTVEPPRGVRVLRTETTEEMKDAVVSEIKTKKYDVVISAAAVNDWQPKTRQQKKVSTRSNQTLSIELVPTPKIIDMIKKLDPEIFLVAFRAQYDLSRDRLIDDAFERLKRAKADLIAVNDVSGQGAGFETDTNEMYLVNPDKSSVHIPLDSKDAVAARIIEAIADKLG